jgi:hypothetical protein
MIELYDKSLKEWANSNAEIKFINRSKESILMNGNESRSWHETAMNVYHRTRMTVPTRSSSPPCSTNGGEEERVYVICRKARRKETTRKTET